ncbi:MAG TPA: hypothetical protein ENH82_11230, partial [bacterium]|nr:hypothetical protein [bacterium]
MRKRRHLYHDSDNMTWPDWNLSRTPDREIIYRNGEPYSAQYDFYTSKAKFICGAGGFGGGKTHALARRALAMMIETPWFGDLSGNIGCIGRKTLKSFEETTLPEFWKIIPGGKRSPWIRKYYKKDGMIEFVNESTLQFTHFDEAEHLQSYNFGFVAIDQMEQLYWEVFKVLGYDRIRNKVLTRFNSSGIQIIPEFDPETGKCVSADPEKLAAWLQYQCVFGVCNPRRGWIYDKFVKNEYYRKLNTPETKRRYNPKYHLVTLSTFDNMANLPPDYIEN